MMKTTTMALLGLWALAPGRITEAQSKPTPWIHIHVEETKDASKVNVNLPFSLVEAAIAMCPEGVHGGKIHFDHHGSDISLAKAREIWKELRAAKDSEIVTVEEKDETVKVFREGDDVRVSVVHPGEKQTVDVRVPVSVVDALLSGEGEDANVKGAIQELEKLRGDVVRVEDKDSKVRIWIDERS
jgi:hypothetical protein